VLNFKKPDISSYVTVRLAYRIYWRRVNTSKFGVNNLIETDGARTVTLHVVHR